MTQSPPRPHHSAEIPIEFVSEEYVSLIEAALTAASAPPSNQLTRNARSIHSITRLSKRTLSGCMQSGNPDIEDFDRVCQSSRPQIKSKRNRVFESFLNRYRSRSGLSVTDITSTEWCEKKMEFLLLSGRSKFNEAMKAGVARHLVLAEEVSKRIKVRVKSVEDAWALKFVKFIVGSNQLLFDGLTRELPVVGFVEGVWMVGVIDEIRMPVTESERFPLLVDTKTRVQPTFPSEPQKRNGRLQLMCYKYLWDTLVAEEFPLHKFFACFSLNPYYILSTEVQEVAEKSGLPSKTLDDLGRLFQNSCCLLPQAGDQLLLRYELQEDQSLLGEVQFDHDPEWLRDQIKSCLEFWRGDREAKRTPMEERWKCNYCEFESICTENYKLYTSSSQRKDTNIPSSETSLAEEPPVLN